MKVERKGSKKSEDTERKMRNRRIEGKCKDRCGEIT